MGARTLVGATVGLRARRSQLGFGLGPKQYNYEHFRRRHLAEEVGAFVVGRGVRPGALAPDFELPAVGGGTVRLSDLRDRPVLLHFGSFT